MATEVQSMANTELMKRYPLTMYTSFLVDASNMKALLKLFDACSQDFDSPHGERVTHSIWACSKMHTAAVKEVLLPMMKELSNVTEEDAQKMTQMTESLEQLANDIDKTKKHLDNDEFVKLMKQFVSLCDEASTAEQQILVESTKKFSEDELIQAQLRVDEAKANVNLVAAA